jgi:hypothetical protein
VPHAVALLLLMVLLVGWSELLHETRAAAVGRRLLKLMHGCR